MLEILNKNYYKTQEVRDLVWVIYSPSLLSTDTCVSTDIELDFPFEISVDKLFFEQLDQDPTALIEYIEQNKTARLGLYFENLLAYYFINHSSYELIIKGLQVQGKKGTIGEFDFIVKKVETNQIYHIETAVKFFLQYHEAQADNSWSHWIGPGCRDRFDLKLNKLIEKQCRLSELPASQVALKPIIGDAQLQSILHLKGCLFNYCRDEKLTYLHENSNRLEGTWCYLGELNQLDPNITWHIGSRLQWLTGGEIASPCKDISDLEQQIQAQFIIPGLETQPVMIIGHNNRDNTEPLERAFVVPDNWPFLGLSKKGSA